MTSPLDIKNARQKGIEAFKSGLNFAQSPYAGFSPDDIELRWQWQIGWLHAEFESIGGRYKWMEKVNHH